MVWASCSAHGEASSANNRAHRPGGGEKPSPGGGRNLLQGPWGAIIFREPGAPARGGRGVLPRGCSESPARANGGPSSSENRAHRPGGDGESSPGGVRSLLPGQWGAIFFREPGAPVRGGRGVLPRGCSDPPARAMGGHLLQRTGRTGLGGTGSPALGVFGDSCKASGGPSSSENRAHRPGGDGESCPGGVRSLLPGQWGAIFFGKPGAPARGGRGVLPRGCSESPARPMGGHLLQRTGRTGPGGTESALQGVFGVSCQANGGPSSSENRAHRSGGDRESCPGGVRILLPGQWVAIFFREPGAPARGGRGVLSRGCSESPARPVGGHLLQRTGRTGPGGTGSPAQGVFGVSCQANGGPSSLENLAHRPGGDGESCPGGVRSLLQGQWGAIFFSGQWNSCNALPHCLGAVDSATPAMRCVTVPEQWAVELLQCTTSLPWCSGQWNSCNALPHCLGAADSATSAMHCLTALGQLAVRVLQYTAALLGGSGQCNSCNAMPHCLGAVGSATPNSCHALPHCLGAAGGATSTMHGLTAWGQWAVQLLQCTAPVPWGQWEVEVLQCTDSLPGGSGQCNSCNALPHCLGAVGSGTPAMHLLNAWGQWAVQLLQCTASLPWGQWTAELLQCTASLPGGSGQWNS